MAEKGVIVKSHISLWFSRKKSKGKISSLTEFEGGEQTERKILNVSPKREKKKKQVIFTSTDWLKIYGYVRTIQSTLERRLEYM